MHVVLAGGGTAGHVEPALATADALRRRMPDVGITLLGTVRGLENRLVPQRGYDLALIPPVPLPRSPTPSLFTVPARMRSAVRDAAEVLRRTQANVVVGFGGYVALPAYLAARGEKVPYVVHEANAKPGLANRWGARFTPYVAVSGSRRVLPHATTVGIPLRRDVATLDRVAMRPAARAHFGLDADRPTLLVSGGSQGARSLNHAVVAAAADFARAGVQVVHVTGPGQLTDVEAALPAAVRAESSNSAAYVVLPYVDRMELAYAAADLMLCRAGAMTCAELAAVGLPAVYVPLPHGNGEQRLNAAPTVAAGGGLLVADAELNAEWILSILVPLVADAGKLADMSAKAAECGHRDADEKLVDMVLTAAKADCR